MGCLINDADVTSNSAIGLYKRSIRIFFATRQVQKSKWTRTIGNLVPFQRFRAGVAWTQMRKPPHTRTQKKGRTQPRALDFGPEQEEVPQPAFHRDFMQESDSWAEGRAGRITPAMRKLAEPDMPTILVYLQDDGSAYYQMVGFAGLRMPVHYDLRDFEKDPKMQEFRVQPHDYDYLEPSPIVEAVLLSYNGRTFMLNTSAYRETLVWPRPTSGLAADQTLAIITDLGEIIPMRHPDNCPRGVHIMRLVIYTSTKGLAKRIFTPAGSIQACVTCAQPAKYVGFRAQLYCSENCYK